MPKRQKPPTIHELQKLIKDSFKRWDQIRRKGTDDPSWPDGMNMNLVRNHVLYDQGRLRELCKTQKVRPCPKETKLKAPRQFSYEYCAPKSKSGPCRAHRAARKKTR